jgi:hypothetical protein
VRASHVAAATFDDPNLVSCGGLAPVAALAERCGLGPLLERHLTVPGTAGANASAKACSVVFGMVAGADSIDDLDLLRHGGMHRLLPDVRAPSTLGTFLRAFRFGHVRQLDAVAARLLAALSARTPLLPGADQMTFIDIDDTVREVHGYAKQGAGFGYSGVRGLNALLATLSTPTSAPVIAAARLRKGSVNSARGARRIVADALAVAQACGAGSINGSDGAGRVLVRMDSAFFTYDALAPVLTHHAHFSVTARMNPAVTAALSRITEPAWTAIRYPQAVWDDDEQRWISDAEVAEIPFTAFTSRRKTEHVPGRLVVRRVKRLQPCPSRPGSGQQSELFTAYRYHAFFTNSPDDVITADLTHRAHAIVEQVIADLKNGPLAHLPSGVFNANAAWLTLTTIAFNLTRAAGCLAGSPHARATTGTLRARLINVPARLARSARRLVLHLPARWPWQTSWTALFTATTGPPPATTS